MKKLLTLLVASGALIGTATVATACNNNNASIQEKADELEKALEEANAKIDDLNGTIASKQTELESATAEVETLRGQIQQLTTQRDQLQTQVTNLTNELAAANAELGTTKSELNIAIANNAIIRSQLKTALEDVKDLSDANKMHVKAIEEAMAQIAVLEKTIVETESNNAAQVQDLTNQILALQSQLLSTAFELEVSNGALRTALNQLKDANAIISGLRNQIALLDDEIIAKNETIDRQVKELGDKVRLIDGLQAILSSKDAEIRVLRKSIEDLTGEKTRLENELASKGQEVEELKKQLEFLLSANIIKTSEQFTAAIMDQQNNQKWAIIGGGADFDLAPTTLHVDSLGQSGYYFPVVKSGISVKGFNKPTLTSSTYRPNGAGHTQNFITVVADDFKLDGVAIKNPTSNKTIEVIAKNFEFTNSSIKRNEAHVNAVGGAIYFAGYKGVKDGAIDKFDIGNVIIKNVFTENCYMTYVNNHWGYGELEGSITLENVVMNNTYATNNIWNPSYMASDDYGVRTITVQQIIKGLTIKAYQTNFDTFNNRTQKTNKATLEEALPGVILEALATI